MPMFVYVSIDVLVYLCASVLAYLNLLDQWPDGIESLPPCSLFALVFVLVHGRWRHVCLGLRERGLGDQKSGSTSSELETPKRSSCSMTRIEAAVQPTQVKPTRHVVRTMVYVVSPSLLSGFSIRLFPSFLSDLYRSLFTCRRFCEWRVKVTFSDVA